MDEISSWLISSDPFIEYLTRLNILHQPETTPEVEIAREAMLHDKKVKALIEELKNWPGSLLVSHKSSGHALHKLVFLADIGLKCDDPDMKEIINRVMQHQDPHGPFQMLTNLSPTYGGSGEDVWAWGLCDAPSVLYSLVKFGLGDDERVIKGIEFLTNLVRENGWPCTGSKEYGTFRGPGKKSDPCPYANLIMVKLLSSIPAYKNNDACHLGAESLLNCWAERKTAHPYIFYMGNDFCKLKAPMVWYDILHVTYVLSQLPWLKTDARLIEMKTIITSKADQQQRFVPESIWLPWKEWDFGQKKVASPYLTYLVTCILTN